MSDERTAKVKKTGYRPKKTKRTFGGKETHKRLGLIAPRQTRKPKDFRNIGDTVQFHVTIEVDGIHFANAYDFARYEGENVIPLAGERCAIRLKDGRVVYLKDDGKSFTWV